MTSEKLIDAIGMIDDELILDARQDKRINFRIVTRIAAVIALVFALSFSVIYYFTAMRTAVTVTFDVNPSLTMSLNARGEVTALSGLNDTGRDVAEHSEIVRGDYAATADHIVAYLYSGGYLDENRNTVLVTVTDTDDTTYEKEIARSITERSPGTAVIAMTLEPDDRIRSLSRRYNISSGKARLVCDLCDLSDYCTEAALVKCGVTELYLYAVCNDVPLEGMTTAGEPAHAGYLTPEQARDIALEEEDISFEELSDMQVILKATDSGFVYLVKFKCGDQGYVVTLSAADGTILSRVHASADAIEDIGKVDEKTDAAVSPTVSASQPMTSSDSQNATQQDGGAVSPSDPAAPTQSVSPTQTASGEKDDAAYTSYYSVTYAYPYADMAVPDVYEKIAVSEVYHSCDVFFDVMNYPYYAERQSCAVLLIFPSMQAMDAYFEEVYTYHTPNSGDELDILHRYFNEEFFRTKAAVILMDVVESEQKDSQIYDILVQPGGTTDKNSDMIVRCDIHPDNVDRTTEMTKRRHVSLRAYSIDKDELVPNNHVVPYGGTFENCHH